MGISDVLSLVVVLAAVAAAVLIVVAAAVLAVVLIVVLAVVLVVVLVVVISCHSMVPPKRNIFCYRSSMAHSLNFIL